MFLWRVLQWTFGIFVALLFIGEIPYLSKCAFYMGDGYFFVGKDNVDLSYIRHDADIYNEVHGVRGDGKEGRIYNFLTGFSTTHKYIIEVAEYNHDYVIIKGTGKSSDEPEKYWLAIKKEFKTYGPLDKNEFIALCKSSDISPIKVKVVESGYSYP